jgi:hypothetical protein
MMSKSAASGDMTQQPKQPVAEEHRFARPDAKADDSKAAPPAPSPSVVLLNPDSAKEIPAEQPPRSARRKSVERPLSQDRREKQVLSDEVERPGRQPGRGRDYKGLREDMMRR